MTELIEVTMPHDERGNDANDFRNDADYKAEIDRRIEAARKPMKSTLAWAEAFRVTPEEAENFENPEWLYENLIISGHVLAVPAQPNGGKTTIFLHVAGVLAEQGVDVFYVNADIAQCDAKEMVQFAERKGFNLLLPDLKSGSMDDVVTNLAGMNESGEDFRNAVFIFDTLKKMTDVINKTRAKELYSLFRSLSAKGLTVVLLCHTNKYSDANGKPVFEGTGDLRADVDDLIYLIPHKNQDGSMTVSTEPDKVRGKFKPITFHITSERKVHQEQMFVDVAEMSLKQQQREDDAPVIELITEAIRAREFTEAAILAHVRNSGTGIGRRSVQSVLRRHTGELWTVVRAFQNNAKQYFLRSEQ